MTRIWHFEEEPTALQIAQIARMLRDGAVALLPTDTVYGLHCSASNTEAIARIVELKGRDAARPFIVLASSVEQLAALGVTLDEERSRALSAIWPAALTVILPLPAPLPASRGAASLAVRVPALHWLRSLLEQSGPIVSTSANRSGEPVVDEPGKFARDSHDRVDAIVDAGPLRGEPSTILDLTGSEPILVRQGEFSFTQDVWKTLRKSL